MQDGAWDPPYKNGRGVVRANGVLGNSLHFKLYMCTSASEE